MYTFVYNWFLGRIPPETAHRISAGSLNALMAIPGIPSLMRRFFRTSDAPVRALGREFPSVLGLAAGFDKNAEIVPGLSTLGFGFVEIGTVTARAQPGNAKPRLFRLPSDRALINRMGFNNDGAMSVAARLSSLRQRKATRDLVIGVNIGKSRSVDLRNLEAVCADYVESAKALGLYADYIAINVSSPNTPGLRTLQDSDVLREILRAVRKALDATTEKYVPLLVKIAPDLTDEEITEVAELARALTLDGVIAVNTTVQREGLCTPEAKVQQCGAGGLSGAPLAERAVDVLGILRKTLPKEVAVISVGGVQSALDVAERVQAGATLVQAFTEMIYAGPAWPSRVLRELAQLQSNNGKA